MAWNTGEVMIREWRQPGGSKTKTYGNTMPQLHVKPSDSCWSGKASCTAMFLMAFLCSPLKRSMSERPCLGMLKNSSFRY